MVAPTLRSNCLLMPLPPCHVMSVILLCCSLFMMVQKQCPKPLYERGGQTYFYRSIKICLSLKVFDIQLIVGVRWRLWRWKDE